MSSIIEMTKDAIIEEGLGRQPLAVRESWDVKDMPIYLRDGRFHRFVGADYHAEDYVFSADDLIAQDWRLLETEERP